MPKGQCQNFDSVIGQAGSEVLHHAQSLDEPGGCDLVRFHRSPSDLPADFTDSYIGTFYESDRGYLNPVVLLLRPVLKLVAEWRCSGDSVSRHYPPRGLMGRGRIRASTPSLFGEYRVKDSLGINLTFRYDGNLSSTFLRTPAVAATPTLPQDRQGTTIIFRTTASKSTSGSAGSP